MEQCLVLFISAHLFTIAIVITNITIPITTTTIIITTITIVIVIITMTIIITSARCSSSLLSWRREMFLGPTLVHPIMVSTKASIKDLAKAPTKAPSKALTRALIKTWAQGRTLPVGSLALSTMEGDCQIPWLPRWLKFTLLHTAGIGNKRMTKLLTKPIWTQVGSPEMCQSLCQARTGCLFFTWVGPTSDVEFYRFHVNVYKCAWNMFQPFQLMWYSYLEQVC